MYRAYAAEVVIDNFTRFTVQQMFNSWLERVVRTVRLEDGSVFHPLGTSRAVFQFLPSGTSRGVFSGGTVDRDAVRRRA